MPVTGSFTDGDRYSGITATNLKGKEGYIVYLDTNGKIALANAATVNILGVLEDGGRVSGDTASVVLINGAGSFRVKCNASTPITKDAYLTSDANGLAIGTTTANDRVFGRAVEAAAVNQVFEYMKANERYSAA